MKSFIKFVFLASPKIWFVTVGMLYRTRARESGVTRISRIVQLRRGKPVNWNFGIKSFYPKIGGMCLHQNLGEERGNSQASRIMPMKESIE